MQTTHQPQELIKFLAQTLVEQPDEVQVVVKDLRRSTVLKLIVAAEDTGRVIGKQGRVANAMRVLLNVAARNEQKPIILEID
jgi:hypothetical protein